MKKEFRKKCILLRDGLLNINPDKKILSLPEYKNAETVFVYLSFGSEVQTLGLVQTALKEKRVVVPFCVDREGTMIACEIKSFDDLQAGMYNIPEPVNPVEYKGKIDLGIIPGVAFSKDGVRLGYGKGYYDRFLAKNKMFKVGLCHDELLFDKIPCGELDVRLDMIITNKREIRL